MVALVCVFNVVMGEGLAGRAGGGVAAAIDAVVTLLHGAGSGCMPRVGISENKLCQTCTATSHYGSRPWCHQRVQYWRSMASSDYKLTHVAIPALPDIGALGLLAHCRQLQAAQLQADLLVPEPWHMNRWISICT